MANNMCLQEPQLLDMLTAYTGAMTTPKTILFINNIVVSPSNVYADLVQPDTSNWTSYAPVSAVFGTTYQNPDDSASSTVPSAQFTGVDGMTSNTVYGYGIADVAGTTLYCAANLPVPVSISSSADSVIVLPTLTLPEINQS